MKKFNRTDVVTNVLNTVTHPTGYDNKIGKAFAPSNIALAKYWGKSDTQLNIPYTDSLSISLGTLGATTEISILSNNSNHAADTDVVYLNDNLVESNSEFYLRIKELLDLIRNYANAHSSKPYNHYYKITTTLNIPVAAGVASSACGFAALILAIDNLFNWQLSKTHLSILARLGSGSACRSLWDGFVYWQTGHAPTGMDSYAFKLDDSWPELRLGLIILSADKKKISSRDAMLSTVETSVLYQKAWKTQVEQDLQLLKLAIQTKDINLLGATAENNALAMHATMLAAKPAVIYSTVETLATMYKVWELRQQGIKVYFTQDAGPNLKLIFDQKYAEVVVSHFNNVHII